MRKQTATSGLPAKKRRSRAQNPIADEHYIDLARSLLRHSWPEIVKGLIAKSRKGGYQHTKLLLDLCGLTGMSTKEVLEKDQSQLSDALLRGLQIYSEKIDGCNEKRTSTSTEGKPVSQDGYEKQTKQ